MPGVPTDLKGRSFTRIGAWSRDELETLGYEVRTAHNGPAALELARRWHPQAIFLDISMPLIDGDEVCRKVREEEWGEDVLIAAVTGFGMPEDRKRSLEAGFDYHLVKPADVRTLQSILRVAPVQESVVAAGPELHARLIERTASLKLK